MIFLIGVALCVTVFLWMFVGGNITGSNLNLIFYKYENLPLVSIITGSFGIRFIAAYLLGLITYFKGLMKDMRIKSLEKSITEQQERMIQLEEALAKERERIKELETGKSPDGTKDTALVPVPENKSLMKSIKDSLNVTKWFK